MFRKYYFIFLSLFILSASSCDKPVVVVTELNTVVTFGTSVELDNGMDEASGLVIDKNNLFWINNDKGNSAVLNVVDVDGKIVKTVNIAAENNDWEDLAKDANDNLYIGDFGNNNNERTNLAIYKIANFSNVTANSVTPEVITFDYEDQSQFPPPDNQMHFDVEGFIATSTKFYLFTKDRSDPFQGITKLYELPNSIGNHTATLLGSFSTASSSDAGAITGAAISPSGRQLVLLSEQKLFLFKDFTTPQFFDTTVEEIDIPVERKFEGIDFQDECTLYLVNEDKGGEKPQLYHVTICE